MNLSVTEAQQKEEERQRRAAAVPDTLPPPPPELTGGELQEMGAGGESARVRFLQMKMNARQAHAAIERADAECTRAFATAPKAITSAEAEYVGIATAGIDPSQRHTIAWNAPHAAKLLAQQDRHGEYRQLKADVEYARDVYLESMKAYRKAEIAAQAEANRRAIAEAQRALEYAQAQAKRYPGNEDLSRDVKAAANRLHTLTQQS